MKEKINSTYSLTWEDFLSLDRIDYRQWKHQQLQMMMEDILFLPFIWAYKIAKMIK